jgi:hypothetical protein
MLRSIPGIPLVVGVWEMLVSGLALISFTLATGNMPVQADFFRIGSFNELALSLQHTI